MEASMVVSSRGHYYSFLLILTDMFTIVSIYVALIKSFIRPNVLSAFLILQTPFISVLVPFSSEDSYLDKNTGHCSSAQI